MNDSKNDHSTCSYAESSIPSNTDFGQANNCGEPKNGLEFSINEWNDHSGIPIIDVCLRVKPQTNNTNHDTLNVLTDDTVVCRNGNDHDFATEYKFSSVFGPNVDQKTFFNTWVYDKVLRFLNGNNELLFAYGTSNSGKTFSIYGNLNDPGIIPRTLFLVFSTLKNKLMSKCMYKPDKVIAAHILDDYYMKAEEDIRNNILNNWSTEKNQDELPSPFQEYKGQTIPNFDQIADNNIIKMFDSLKNDRNPLLNHNNVSYTLWVSYVEIYNESVYDLLVSYSVNQKRIPLKLSLDHNKNVYVKGLTHVFVQSAEEAYKVMTFGKNNLNITSNFLNKSSSRSHCIFTIKLLRVDNIENPKSAVISSISFCDLASSEQLKKTMNISDRLTESKNINTSLLVLNKCFSVLRENQKHGKNHLVPCRESKLTQMFQTSLTGICKNGISMIVNVDMAPDLFEETKKVLYVSAIERSITKANVKRNAKPKPNFIKWVAKNSESLSLSKSELSVIIEDNENSDVSNFEEELMITKTNVEIRLLEERARLRKELLSQFQTILDNNKTFHKNQKEKMIKMKTKMYEDKMNCLKTYYLEEIKEIKKNPNSYNNLKNHHENSKNKIEVENYEFRINELEMQQEGLLAEINVLKNSQNIWQEEINVKNQEIEGYKTMLEEANDVYERLENDYNEISNILLEKSEDLEKKNLDIERLTGTIEVKDNIIKEMENNQDKLTTEMAEQKLLQYMNEKLEIIAGFLATQSINDV